MKTWADYEHARRPLGEYQRTRYLTCGSVVQEWERQYGERRARPARTSMIAEDRDLPKRLTTPYVCGGSIMDGLRRARYTIRPTKAERAWLAALKLKAMAARESVTAVTDSR